MTLRAQSSSELSWPVNLFRFTASHGWQALAGEDGHLSLEATPRKDCIVIPALHQKFSLSNDNQERGTVIRRDKCVLLLSRTRTKAMVLRFQSLEDCLEFSNHFLQLNPIETLSTVPPSSAPPAQRHAVLSHLVRLMHEPDFETLVHNIERTLQETDDGAAMLESWIERDASTHAY